VDQWQRGLAGLGEADGDHPEVAPKLGPLRASEQCRAREGAVSREAVHPSSAPGGADRTLAGAALFALRTRNKLDAEKVPLKRRNNSLFNRFGLAAAYAPKTSFVIGRDLRDEFVLPDYGM
jgi:hypothetical protein